MNQEERSRLLEQYRDLRVADVRDGLDRKGTHHYGSVSPSIRPLFRTKVCGIARTARYLPFQGPVPHLTPDEYREWTGWYYKNVCTYPWMEEIEEGDFICIDESGVDVGLMGSHNGLIGIRKGARGYVTNGGVRDTDEVILQKVPFWAGLISQGMVQARLQFESKDVPIALGGVVIYPGDVVVGDGDGIVVVPQEMAAEVAEYAHGMLSSDKAARRKVYEQLGRELDDTVR